MGAEGFSPTASVGASTIANPTAWRMNAQARLDEAHRRGLKLIHNPFTTPPQFCLYRRTRCATINMLTKFPPCTIIKGSYRTSNYIAPQT